MIVKKNKNGSKFHPVAFHVAISFAIVFAYLYAETVDWFRNQFGIGIEQIVFTINSPLKGGNMEFFSTLLAFFSVHTATFIVVLYAAFAILYEFVFSKLEMRISVSVRKKGVFSIDIYSALRRAILFLLFGIIVIQTFNACASLHLGKYFFSKGENSTIYEDFYHQPQSAALKGSGKNLIYIYLESMETAYASKADGGHQATRNYIPHLTDLAKDNVNFSAKKGFGGFRPANGATWTMGALFSSSTGIPFAFPIGGNQQNLYDAIGKNVVTLGDLLSEKGYVQEFLCGSDGDFAGRKQFFEQHGGYKVFDLFTAREENYIDEDYKVWWGFEDEILYCIARDELTKLAARDEKFNFTMLTVDTHHIGGYVCQRCGNNFPTPVENVLECADNQLYEFIQWIREQEFFKDTVIVISGDHPRMDTFLVEGLDYNNRFVYNCFINAQVQNEFKAKGREFTALDMFPTVLSAMGFQVDGERLGLGTNLFSEEKTLSEELGFEQFNAELLKHSNFYAKNFY